MIPFSGVVYIIIVTMALGLLIGALIISWVLERFYLRKINALEKELIKAKAEFHPSDIVKVITEPFQRN